MKTLLSLFDYSGIWSMPYAEAGWNVVRIDSKLDTDYFSEFSTAVNEINTDWMYENIFDNYGTVDGILSAVPCTDFAGSGARHWEKKDKPEMTLFGEFSRLDYFKELVYQTLRVVDLCEPDFWALENPVGRINKIVPELGEPWYFQPFWFGDPYTKKTGLWGNFNKPEKSNVVEPVLGSKMHSMYGGKSQKTKMLRSITPEGFARAFYAANH